MKVGLDSQCLSYLIDAVAGVAEPIDPLAEERKALIRIWWYTPETFYVSEAVLGETAKICDVDRGALHKGFVNVLFLDLPVRDKNKVQTRSKQFELKHSGILDCRILAEAEDLGLDVLLTYDDKFHRRLGRASPVVQLLTPFSHWSSLGIPKGAKPVTEPHPTNPLSKERWWRWE